MITAESQQRERVPVHIFTSGDEAAARVADTIVQLIQRKTAAGERTVLGLATGSTPVRLYRELIRRHREEGLSFQNVITFNLDEYYGLPPTHPESYARFMREQLFDHIDIDPNNVHIPDGLAARTEIFAWCQRYEDQIRQSGGIDLQILGIGRSGHIGFNEPGSSRESRTRLVTLDGITRGDAARDFLGEANVPRYAITMGIGTILDAREVVLLAWGKSKARVVASAVEQRPTDTLPASFLQEHPNAQVLVDVAAAAQLTRVARPWLVGVVQWNQRLTRSAVVWLSATVKKPVLKLVDQDYSENGMADLLTEHGSAYALNIRIFNELQHTITGWPGGKPNCDDTYRPERASPVAKRAIVFSPEPSDDVLGMGGTLRRLEQQGHHVTVVYQTSGDLAVPDKVAQRAIELVLELGKIADRNESDNLAVARAAMRELLEKSELDVDGPDLRRFKAILRRGEARSALAECGIASQQVQFLDLPFYEHGRYRRFKLGEADIDMTVTLLRRIQPHQVFVCGRGDDPTSVAGICFEAVWRALIATAADPWATDCRVWHYRSPDKEWNAADIDMAVPLSPQELATKIEAIFQHATQRTQTPLDAGGVRENWQLAENTNRAVARQYDSLGLAEYEAVESFERISVSDGRVHSTNA